MWGSLTVKDRVFYQNRNEKVHRSLAELQMKRPLPRTVAQWLHEIKLAIADALDAKLFGPLVGTEVVFERNRPRHLFLAVARRECWNELPF